MTATLCVLLVKLTMVSYENSEIMELSDQFIYFLGDTKHIYSMMLFLFCPDQESVKNTLVLRDLEQTVCPVSATKYKIWSIS